LESVSVNGFYNTEVFSVLNNRPLGGNAEWEALLKKREKEVLFMGMPDVLNSKVLKLFIKGSLVVTGLFVVLYCGVAMLALFSCCKCVKSVCENNVWPLIAVLVIPLLVFLTVFLKFTCLVKLHYEKFYGPSCVIYKGTLFKRPKIEVTGETSLMMAIKTDSEKDRESLKELKEIHTLLLKINDNIMKFSKSK